VTDLLRVRNLHVSFAAPGGFIRAVTGVSFRVRPRSVVALVGESGSGKSVVSQTILRSFPAAVRSHRVRYCLPIPSSMARSSISRNCRTTARSCGRYAAGEYRLSFKSR